MNGTRFLRTCFRVPVVLGLLAVCLAAWAPGAPAQQAPRLRVSDDGRHLLRADGTPFFWLADTAWELFHRLDREEADFYLTDRARKGFTVIQAVVLAELDGLNTPNPYGALPLHDLDPTRPNEAYFAYVDDVVRLADSLGLVIGMLPTWGDKWNKKWGVGPEIFTPENARAFGRFLGERYREAPVVWILGGDRNPEDEEDLAVIRAMAEGLAEGDGGMHLMTYHPQGGSKSFEWFHDDPWLDFNLFQSGHQAFDIPNYRFTEEGYRKTPARPVLDGEPRYEDHPVNWKPEEGWFGDFDVRQAAYWSVLSGAAGHTYGDHNIWQMWQPGRAPVSSARTPWREAVAHPGAAQMGYLRALVTSRPFLELVPDLALVAGSAGDGPAAQRAARGRDGSFAFVYTPYGEPVVVDLEKLSGETMRAYWFDPRTGAAVEIGMFPREGTRPFDPPGEAGRGNDWVLVVDDAARGYPAPGATATPSGP